MTQSKPTSRIAGLHSLAVSRGFPRDQVHDLLHDAAVRMFGVGSMKQCNARQLDELERWVRSHRDPATRSRRPHARGSEHASMKVASRAQRKLIAEISGELGWNDETLAAAVKHHLGLDAIHTAAQAARVIRLLITFNRGNRRSYPGNRDKRGLWHDSKSRSV